MFPTGAEDEGVQRAGLLESVQSPARQLERHRGQHRQERSFEVAAERGESAQAEDSERGGRPQEGVPRLQSGLVCSCTNCL